MQNAIEINNLTKIYRNFSLENIGFSVPSGFISGFIGQNGAGKTTTLKLALNMAIKDGGDITIFDKPAEDISVKEDIGVLFDGPYYQEDWTPGDIEKAMRPFYKQWDSAAYNKYLRKFSLDPRQKFKFMSRGMKMKLGMAAALSHGAKLLMLDEPTSGLDPVMRDEMLGILQDYMAESEDRSVFFSTHITSDLEKIADYIVYIHNGKILYSGQKDDLTEKYCLVKGGKDDLPKEKRADIIGLREHVGGFEGMAEVSKIGGFPAGAVTEPVSLDDIMVYINRNINNRTGEEI